MAKAGAANTETSGPKKKREKISQSDIPAFSLSEALKVAKALYDNYAGGPEAPHNVAIACELSPTSSSWRMLAGAALAYGLTTGSFSAESIQLTELGKRILSPTSEGDDQAGFREAALRPKVLRDFFQKYDRNKFPADKIAENVLYEMGIPRDKVTSYLSILKKNGDEAGFITQTRGGPFVATNFSAPRSTPLPGIQAHDDVPGAEADEISNTQELSVPGAAQVQYATQNPMNPWDQPIKRVFVSHGKNQEILSQVKEIVLFGKFEPVISKDRETVSKPVPDKVMDDMRSCQAAVIHVAGEKVLADEEGKLYPQINGNVLIEIGAAIALYKRKFILLVEDGLTLPSNLQGLYEVRYSGSTLDGIATMKLLKAFNDFSQA
jgi:predicted nucleotide-binding protein